MSLLERQANKRKAPPSEISFTTTFYVQGGCWSREFIQNQMFIEIEETVCFLSSFLYDNLPRMRIEAFAEFLANLLVDKVYDPSASLPLSHLSLVVNVADECDEVLKKAAEKLFIPLPLLLSLFPPNLIIEVKEGAINAVNAVTGSVKIVFPIGRGTESSRRARVHTDRRPMHLSLQTAKAGEEDKIATKRGKKKRSSVRSLGMPKPYFEAHTCELMTSRSFAATRFGSSKLKTPQRMSRFDMSSSVSPERGLQPFTMPSKSTYLRLLIVLNAIACAMTATKDGFVKDSDSSSENLSAYDEGEKSSDEAENGHGKSSAGSESGYISMEHLLKEKKKLADASDGITDDEASVLEHLLREECEMAMQKGFGNDGLPLVQ